MTASQISLKSPLRGSIVALADVPDTMFALGLMGDGLAIEPATGEVRAPCAGRVTSVHTRGHAIRIMTEIGAEVLLHVGLEAVAMNGTGLKALVTEGQEVSVGTPLLTFDPDALRASCDIITTPVLMSSDDGFEIELTATGEVDFGDELMVIRPASGAETGGDDGASRGEVVLELEHGMHARPAALLANEAKKFSSQVEIAFEGRTANAKSPVSLLTLGCRWGSALEVIAKGDDAAAAVKTIVSAIKEGLGDPLKPWTGALDHGDIIEEEPADTTPFGPDETPELSGVTAAPGIAIGTVKKSAVQLERPREPGGDPAAERSALDAAVAEVLEHLKSMAETGRTAQQRDIMAAHAILLEDPDLRDTAYMHIDAGKSAGWAWCEAIAHQVRILLGLNNPRLAERAADLTDLEQQVLTVLAGGKLSASALEEDTVIVADDLLPSQFMSFGDNLPVAIVLANGGRTSHVAILAASSGVPMICAVGPDALRINEGSPVIVDGARGRISVNPSPETIDSTRAAIKARKERQAANRETAGETCYMADGTRLPIYANVGSSQDAVLGKAVGAEGSGLLRTEFLFLERMSAPTEAEQQGEYQAVLQGLGSDVPLTIRTLDIGGDKPIAYLRQPNEENPILGLRGIRVCQKYPEILRTQYRAILKVKPVSSLRVMLPMVADVADLRWAKEVFEEEKAKLGITEHVPLGIMIEVPSAVALAGQLAKTADFFSVGTNDLTQYCLAMDRGNPELASRIDGLHPAVLRMIGQTCDAAAPLDRPVGVCGGLASELPAAPILIGLGVKSLSATRAGIPDLKAFVRTLDMDKCREIAQQALELESADEVRALVEKHWPGI